MCACANDTGLQWQSESRASKTYHSGVVPIWFLCSRLALASSIRFTTSTAPLKQAAPNAELPSASPASAPQPASSRRLTAAMSFCMAACTISVPCDEAFEPLAPMVGTFAVAMNPELCPDLFLLLASAVPGFIPFVEQFDPCADVFDNL
eukprot:3936215-Rhodomonas_salina.1